VLFFVPRVVYKIDQSTRDFITRTVELWNRWIRLPCYYNRVYTTCLLYTHIPPIL